MTHQPAAASSSKLYMQPSRCGRREDVWNKRIALNMFE